MYLSFTHQFWNYVIDANRYFRQWVGLAAEINGLVTFYYCLNSYCSCLLFYYSRIEDANWNGFYRSHQIFYKITSCRRHFLCSFTVLLLPWSCYKSRKYNRADETRPASVQVQCYQQRSLVNDRLCTTV